MIQETRIRETIEWSNFRWFDAPDRQRPRVLLVGDSIVVGHGAQVHEALAPAGAVDYLASSRCVSDVDYRGELDYLLNRTAYAAVVFNNTLHGFDIDDAVYAEFLDRTLRYIRPRTPHLIWRNGTPYRQPGDNTRPHPEYADRVIERNRLAAAIAAELELPVIDLYSEMLNHLDFFAADGVHYLPAGCAFQAGIIARAVKPLL